MWRELWCRGPEASGQVGETGKLGLARARELRLPLGEAEGGSADVGSVNAIEIELSTEVQAACSVPPSHHCRHCSRRRAFATAAIAVTGCCTLGPQGWGEEVWSEIDAIRLDGCASTGGTSAVPAAARLDLAQQPWETDSAHSDRVRFVLSKYGVSPPAEAAARMRQAALSMVYSNMKLLGCRYPSEVEQQVERQLGSERHEAQSGYALSGQMAASRAAREAA